MSETSNRRECARQGCTRYAPVDDYCSTACFREANGTLAAGEETAAERRNRRRRVKALEKKLGASVVEIENPDAMTRLAGVIGSGQGRRRRTVKSRGSHPK